MEDDKSNINKSEIATFILGTIQRKLNNKDWLGVIQDCHEMIENRNFIWGTMHFGRALGLYEAKKYNQALEDVNKAMRILNKKDEMLETLKIKIEYELAKKNKEVN